MPKGKTLNPQQIQVAVERLRARVPKAKVAEGLGIADRSLRRLLADPASTLAKAVEADARQRDAAERKATYDYQRRHDPDAINPALKPEYAERGARTGGLVPDVPAALAEARTRVAVAPPTAAKELSDSQAEALWRLNGRYRTGKVTTEEYNEQHAEIIHGTHPGGRTPQVQIFSIPRASESLDLSPPAWAAVDVFAGSYGPSRD